MRGFKDGSSRIQKQMATGGEVDGGHRGQWDFYLRRAVLSELASREKLPAQEAWAGAQQGSGRDAKRSLAWGSTRRRRRRSEGHQ